MTAPKPSELAFVPFVSVENMMKLVHHIGIEQMLRDLGDYIEDDFRRWELFDKTPRVASHSEEGVIELMPTSDGEVYGFKYVNGHPKNTKAGLQTVTAFGLLARVDTGYPVMLSEMTVLTAMRTAATSAMVAKHLAPKGSKTMAMIGNGAQSEFQALAMKAICGIENLYPDEHLYAGGISRMEKSQFLNPHLDNSHDKDRDKWRVLNLLYYVSPGWQQSFGGNLELWPQGMGGKQVTIFSRFNRLAVMATHEASWHSVSPVTEDAARCCISNYYFSDSALKDNLDFHVTSFRGRPEQKFRDLVLQADAAFRMGIRKIFSKGVVDTGHVYKK